MTTVAAQARLLAAAPPVTRPVESVLSGVDDFETECRVGFERVGAGLCPTLMLGRMSPSGFSGRDQVKHPIVAPALNDRPAHLTGRGLATPAIHCCKFG
mgnify:CR=1 FL=1